MISAFFILNLKGEVLISRLFRPDLKSVSSLSLAPKGFPRASTDEHTCAVQAFDLGHFPDPRRREFDPADFAPHHAQQHDLLPRPTRRFVARRSLQTCQ